MEGILTATVYGEARPQGSKRFGVSESGKPYGYETVKGSRPWRKEVKQVLGRAFANRPRIEGPVVVEIVIYMHRPKSRKGQVWHVTVPDADKLARNVLDAMQETILGNDSQVCLARVWKLYSDHPRIELTVGRPTEDDLPSGYHDGDDDA